MLAVPVQQGAAFATEANPAVSGSEARDALAEAQESGRRVEVAGERSERTTTYANPDGFTFTLEESAVPVRVSRPGGGWQAPDATLVKRSDGSVGPKAAAVSIAFSAGGNKAPLASIEDQGKSLELTWAGALPTPQLDGPSALYPEVLAGVDLKVTATPESFQPVFVVKTPEAAANDELHKLTFGLKAQGLDVREGASGNLAAVDDSGRTVFKAPPARMWDSAGEAASTQTQLVTADTPGTAEVEPSDPSESAPSGLGLEPGQGDAVARMDVAVTKDSLSVVPDAKMLSTTEESAFPLFIDPTVSWGESERTLLRSDGYESYGWSNGDDDQGKGVGKCGSWKGYYCGPGYVQKLYFEFSPASLKGKHILDATFRVTEPWAFQCDPRWVDLVRTNNISSATTWSSRPAELDLMVDRHISAGRGSLCDPDSPDAPVEFNDNAAETNENLTPTVRDFAAGKFSRLTLEIKAHDEGDTAAWKRFKNDATLAVKYVGLPDTPTEVGVVAGSSYVCATNSAVPNIVSDPTPLVQGKPRTAAGGSVGASLRIRWRTEKYDASTSTWVLAHTDLDSPTSGYVGNLVRQAKTLPTLTEGVLYRLKALTLSSYEDGTNRLNSGYSAPCYFKVDPTAPKAPQVGFGSPYTQCTTNACVAGGGPGTPGAFSFAPAVGDTNIAAYQYKLSLNAAWSADQTGSTKTVTITPDSAGTYRLYVRAKDNVGRYGAESVVDFLVATGPGPIGRWNFSEASGAALDSATSDGQDNATLGGGAVRDDRGRRGLINRDPQGLPLETPITDAGLSLNGSTAYAQTAAPALETRSAFTLSAWVRLERNDRNAAVLSTKDSVSSPFLLEYAVDKKTWFFGIRQPGQSDWYFGQYAAYPAQVGVWTHLTGTYDPATDKLMLYVDGRSQYQGQTVDGSYSSTAPLDFGRHQLSTGPGYYFQGSIDEVAVWQQALSAQQVAEEAELLTSDGYAGVELMADWSADRGSNGTVDDTTSGYGKRLTLSGGASLEDGDIVLDGVDGSASTPGPLVSEHASFTVTTLVQLDTAKLLPKDIGYVGQVLGQPAADGSSWGFWYELTGKQTGLNEDTGEESTVPVGKWHFGRLDSAGNFTSVISDKDVALDSQVRLTGIYNSLNGTISLYLGYNQNGDARAFTVKLGSGDFAIGAESTGTTWRHHLPARVREVRLWAGAMASSAQIEETVGD
ncbi:LamG domain protein jellyroll fold domain protein [Streptomyces sp. ID05-39B]|uniref:LamG-like jellyroll fold domain-containing protein n=1 Tax=Streptomyces sp. ID05-39B TaxID=3028664 RepID=UPI0029BC8E6F|nr:LamG-like jellyroll fold domain-containing protein [Streptomyces sp. ID05-39B]MDX3526995.1 LamG domain protein jellyroll fold domain protein [Streptomyces sp. ID05-39B]